MITSPNLVKNNFKSEKNLMQIQHFSPKKDDKRLYDINNVDEYYITKKNKLQESKDPDEEIDIFEKYI